MLNILYSKHGLVLTSKCETCWKSLHHNRLIIMFHHQLLLVLHGWTGVNYAHKHLRQNRWKVSSWGSWQTGASCPKKQLASQIKYWFMYLIYFPCLDKVQVQRFEDMDPLIPDHVGHVFTILRFWKFAAKTYVATPSHSIPFHSHSVPWHLGFAAKAVEMGKHRSQLRGFVRSPVLQQKAHADARTLGNQIMGWYDPWSCLSLPSSDKDLDANSDAK